MKILLLQLKRIGDLVLTTPAIVCLREKFPEAELVLVIEGGSAGLLPLVDHDRAIILRRGKLEPAKWASLWREKFDVCLDFTGNDRSALVTVFSGAARRLTWTRFCKKPFRKRIYTEFVESRVQDCHTADHHTDLLRPLGIERRGVPSRLRVPEETRARVDALLVERGVQGPFAVVHPGTARPEKYWLPGGWAEVIRACVEQYGLQVVITGSPAPEEMQHLEKIFTECGPELSGQLVNLAGQCSLSELAGVLKKSRVVCGVDSAPLHFADALQVPVLALFGPTNPHQWQPRDTASMILTPPGTKPVGPKYHPGAPVNTIPVDQVLGALGTLLQRLDTP